MLVLPILDPAQPTDRHHVPLRRIQPAPQIPDHQANHILSLALTKVAHQSTVTKVHGIDQTLCILYRHMLTARQTLGCHRGCQQVPRLCWPSRAKGYGVGDCRGSYRRQGEGEGE